MCGIIAVLSRPETRSVPVAADVLGQLAAVVNQWPLEGAALPSDAALEVMGQQMSAIDSSLRGDAGMWLMAGNREFVAALGTSLDQMQGRITAAESALETSGTLGAAALEHRLGLLTVLRDAVWSIRMDRLRTAAAVDRCGVMVCRQMTHACARCLAHVMTTASLRLARYASPVQRGHLSTRQQQKSVSSETTPELCAMPFCKMTCCDSW